MEGLFVIFFMRQRNNTLLRIRRGLRDASDPFMIPENEFRSLYRLSRDAVRVLVDELRPLVPAPRKRYGIPVELQICKQVLSALNFLASGSYQKRVGQDYLSCMSQPTVSKILHNVVDALNILMENWIN